MRSDADLQHANLTLPGILARQARVSPDHPFLHTAEGRISYREASQRVNSYASGLACAGIGTGDRVALLMANSIEQVLVWFALNRVGAISVPLNSALTADLLARALRLVQPAAFVADGGLVPALAEAMDSAGQRGPIFSRGTATLRAARPLTDLEGGPAADHAAAAQPLAAAVMLFTSGSTGVPKACVLSHHYLVRQAQIHAKYLRFGPGDVLYTCFPLFHIDAATLTVGAAVVTGATAAISGRFSASRFWDEVRAFDATVFNFMGATANILWKQPPNTTDRQHRVRLAWGVPMPACEPVWEQRFGFPLVEAYGLTDAGCPAYQPLDEPRRPGSCGRVIDEYQVRIAGPSGDPAPAGAVGEILIRSDEPGLVMNEYYGMPEATSQAFRDGWFHTGDSGRLDSDGYLYFVARNKETIRRRGENIAASDIETAIDAHPDVTESAAVAVPSELSEDDIKVYVVAQPGAILRPEDVFEHCRRVLPRTMIPRYIEMLPALPKTPTEKIERFRLAARPATPATWDAERSADELR